MHSARFEGAQNIVGAAETRRNAQIALAKCPFLAHVSFRNFIVHDP